MNLTNNKYWLEIKSYFEKTCLTLSEQAEIMSGPLQMAFDITNRCMMKCSHCFNRSSRVKRDELNDEQVYKTFSDILEIRPQQICICGGEPLLRKKILLEGSQRLKDAGIFLGMVTNGYLINKKVAKQLAEIGFDQIQVSLDGFERSHDRLRGVPGAHSRAVAAIKHLCDAGIKTLTSFAPTKFNIEEFPEYVEYVKSLGVKEVRIQPLMLIGEALLNLNIFPDEDQYYELTRFIRQYNFKNSLLQNNEFFDVNEIRLDETENFIVSWGDPVDHIIRFSTILTKPTFSVQIHSNGNIGFCPYIPITIGNVNKYSLQEYWDAGLNRIWEYSIVQKVARQIRCIYSMGDINPPIYFANSFEVDLVESSKHELDEIAEYIFESY